MESERVDEPGARATQEPSMKAELSGSLSRSLDPRRAASDTRPIDGYHFLFALEGDKIRGLKSTAIPKEALPGRPIETE
jgi:hypothetical protein